MINREYICSCYNVSLMAYLHLDVDILLDLSRVQEHGGEPIIPFSCALERNLSDMPQDEAEKYCEDNKTQRLDHDEFSWNWEDSCISLVI